MKIAMLLEDELLQDSFRQHKLRALSELEFYMIPEAVLQAMASMDFHALVVSDRYYTLAAMCEFIERVREIRHPQIILLLSNHHDQALQSKWMKYCLANDLSFVYPGQAASRIAEQVYRKIFTAQPAEEKPARPTVLFMGTTPNIGTTVIAYAAAKQIAMQTEQQVVYACLNLKSSKIHSYMGIRQPVVSLDEIRAEIKSRGLTNERIKQYCVRDKACPNFSVLMGNRLREQAEFYNVEDIHYLLQQLSDTFDLCIIEVSSYWDNAATVGGLLYADTKIIISTDQLAHFQEDMERWVQNGMTIFDLDKHQFDLFITQVSKTAANGYSIKDIRKESGMNVIGHVNELAQVKRMLNEGRIDELVANDQELITGISGLLRMLIALYDLDPKRPETAKRWLNRLLFQNS